MTQSVIIGSGSYLPEKILDNHALSKMVDTNNEWIIERTGIHTRHIAADNQHTSDLAAHAAQSALQAANMSAEDIDLIIVATTTPDNTFPSTATRVQALLDATHAAAFDVQAVCTGFVYAIEVADSMIKTGKYKNVLVIGADCLSRIVDWTDRGTCILFGDGAGALVLQAQENTTRGVLKTRIFSDGKTRELLHTDGGACHQNSGVIKMEGREVFKHAIRKLSKATRDILEEHQLTAKDVDWMIPHQANLRIIDALGDKLDIPTNKRVATVGQHANTSAATIPMAIDVAARDGRLQKEHLLALPAIGGGLTWGVSLVYW